MITPWCRRLLALCSAPMPASAALLPPHAGAAARGVWAAVCAGCAAQPCAHATQPLPPPPPPARRQALKLDDDGAREEAVLSCLHAALEYAVAGAVAHRSIQCVVLCVFTLHCCRGRGSAEQKQQRQGWHTQLSDALPAGDRAKWAAVGWVDPRLESHATQVRPAALPLLCRCCAAAVVPLLAPALAAGADARASAQVEAALLADGRGSLQARAWHGAAAAAARHLHWHPCPPSAARLPPHAGPVWV